MLGQNVRFGGPLTPVVKKLMIINGAIFLLMTIAGLFSPGFPAVIKNNFGLSHLGFAHQFKLWQIFTYMFLHGSFFHVFMNLFALWMFSGDLEQLWGGRRFLRYYITTGMGAGICIAFMNFIIADSYGVSPVTIGASGAVYAILLAYGLTWPNRQVLVWFVIPVKMKYLVMIFGLFEFFGTLGTVSGSGGNISHIGHLGGLLSGLVVLLGVRRFEMKGGSTAARGGFLEDFFRKRRNERKRIEISRRIEAKKIIDALLEKIARGGMSSLTPDERKSLEWARKNYYPDSGDTMH